MATPHPSIDCLISFLIDSHTLAFRDVTLTYPGLKLRVHEEPDAKPRLVSSRGGSWMEEAGLCLVRCTVQTRLSVLLPPSPHESDEEPNKGGEGIIIKSRILDGGASPKDLSLAISEGFKALSSALLANQGPSPCSSSEIAYLISLAPNEGSETSSSSSASGSAKAPGGGGGLRAKLVTSETPGSLSDLFPHLHRPSEPQPWSPSEPSFMAGPLTLPPSDGPSPFAPSFDFHPHLPPGSIRVELGCPITLDLLALIPWSLPASDIGPKVLTPALLDQVSHLLPGQ